MFECLLFESQLFVIVYCAAVLGVLSMELKLGQSRESPHISRAEQGLVISVMSK